MEPAENPTAEKNENKHEIKKTVFFIVSVLFLPFIIIPYFLYAVEIANNIYDPNKAFEQLIGLHLFGLSAFSALFFTAKIAYKFYTLIGIIAMAMFFVGSRGFGPAIYLTIVIYNLLCLNTIRIGMIGAKIDSAATCLLSLFGVLALIGSLPLSFMIGLSISANMRSIQSDDYHAKKTIEAIITQNEEFRKKSQNSSYTKFLFKLNLSSYFYQPDFENDDIDEYYIRYTTMIDKTGKVVSYVVCAWPKEIGKTGTKFYIASEAGIIYMREANPKMKMPITKWPDNKTLESEWTRIIKQKDDKDKTEE